MNYLDIVLPGSTDNNHAQEILEFPIKYKKIS